MKKGDPRVINAWAMYDWANSVYSLTITTAIFPIFFLAATNSNGLDLVQEKWGIPAESVYSYFLSAGFLVVALLVPLLSGIADYSGKKKFFMKIFCYLGAAACIGLYFFSVNHLFPSLLLVSLACIGFSGSLVFYDAFLPEIAEPSDHDRISAKGYRMGYYGSVLLLIFNLFMVMKPELFGMQAGTSTPARISFITVGIWWAGFAQIPFRRLPDNVFGKKINNGMLLNGYKELRSTFSDLLKTARLKRYLLAFFLLNIGLQTVMYLAVTFAKEEIKDVDSAGALVPISDTSLIVSILIIQLVAAVGATVFYKASGKFGNLRTLMMAAVIWVFACVVAFNINYTNGFYALAGLVGFVMGGTQAIGRSTYSKFLPDTQDHASYFSFYDVSNYLGTVIGTFVYGLVYHLTGDLRNTVLAIGTFFVFGLLMLMVVPQEERSLS